VLSGDKSAWPIYLSIGNIASRTRNKPSQQCWVLIAYIPTPVFKDPDNLHTALQHRLFHQCLKFILEPLHAAGTDGVYMKDALGNIRHCFLRVAAYLADYPEQVLLNVAAHRNSPVTTAGNHDLGNATPHPRRTREWILARIKQASQIADPKDVAAYQKAARELGLNAVSEPFWENLPKYEPDLVMAPDILHGLLRFWRDHILKWVIHLVGQRELDQRAQAVQHIVGIRHFTNGISHLSQWTGREDRELQRILLAIIAGSPQMEPRVIRCLRAFHDFLYLAQYRSHNPSTLGYLQKALNTFHSLKNVFINNGARRGDKKLIRHFKIPKLCGLHAYSYHIPWMGSSPQFSTEITEQCHKVMAKLAYKATNHRNYAIQMCHFMNRRDVILLTQELVAWNAGRELHGRHEEHFQGQSQDDEDLAAPIEANMTSSEAPKVRVDIRKQRTGHIWHTVNPDVVHTSLKEVLSLYRIRHFARDLAQFFNQAAPAFPVSLSLLTFDLWDRCRIQLPSIQDDDELAEVRTVQSIAPGRHSGKYGLCNCVLIRKSDNAEVARLQGIS
jgi:hypothetical protein